MNIPYSLRTLVALMLFNFVTISPAQAEERTVKAISAWQGLGLISQVAENLAYAVGAWSGVMFIDGGKGKLDAAGLLCPGTMETNLANGNRIGQGRCILTDKDGDKVYAKWTCLGGNAGCKGLFTFTGGTGKFQGISGKNQFVVRVAMRAFSAEVAKDSFQQIATGLAVWPKLHYKIP